MRDRANLLVLNLGMDVRHSALGHVPAWTAALAERAAHVDVITMFEGEHDVPANVTVRSIGKERGYSEPRRLAEFYSALNAALRARPVDACFAHMAPLFAVLAAPELRRRGIPLLLWYAHPATSRTLRLAHRVADRVVTPTPASFPLASDKLRIVGHGVDTERFRPPAEPASGGPPVALTVGRITPRKRIAEMIDAVALVDGLELDVVGGTLAAGDEAHAAALRARAAERGVDGRVRFHGPVRHDAVDPWYHRGEVFLNVSDTALDKATLEAMASGCVPVSRNPAFAEMAAANGLTELVPAPGADGLAAGIRRVLELSPEARTALAGRCRGAVERDHGLAPLADRLVAELEDMAGLNRSRPRALFVGASSYELPLPAPLRRKWDAVAGELDIRVVGRGEDSEDERFRLLSPPFGTTVNPLWYARLPAAVWRESRRFRPDVVVTQSPFEAFPLLFVLPLLRPRPKLVVELHGDTSLAARHYGSPLRRMIAPLADRAATVALRRADATRAVSRASARQAVAARGRDPESLFHTYFDLSAFTARPPVPPPERPTVAWIGTMQGTKDPHALVEVWKLVSQALPDARLVIVGDGPLRAVVEEAAAADPEHITHHPRLDPSAVAAVLDESTALCLTSVSEGMPRVGLEAFARARPVVTFAVGGLPELVDEGRSGFLVERRDIDALADRVIATIRDRDFARKMGETGHEAVSEMVLTPERYATAVAAMVRAVAA